MSADMVALTINGTDYKYPAHTRYEQIAADFQPEYEDEILMVLEDQRIRELHAFADRDCCVTFLTIKDSIGSNAYLRSLSLLMLRALKDVAGEDADLLFHFTTPDGLFCTGRNVEITEELLSALEKRMHEIAEKNLPIEKASLPTGEAVRLFRDRKMYDKVQLFKYRMSSWTNVYRLDGYVDYYYGYMLASTGPLKSFRLKLLKDGFLVWYPAHYRQDSDTDGTAPGDLLFQVQRESKRWGRELGISDVGDLNDVVVKCGARDLILVQEAYFEAQIAGIAKTLAEDKRKRIIMIAGPSSSGKTTFSHRLSIQLTAHGFRPHPIAMDDYFVDREHTPRDENGEYDFEVPEAIDIEQFNQDMLDLLDGKTVSMPTFNFRTGKREYNGKTLRMGEEDILVIEGIHCLNDSMSYRLPADCRYRIYISALTQLNIDEHNRIPSRDGRLIRRIVRDARTRGTKAEKTIAMWPSVRRGEERHIFPNQEKADVMFNSALIYELAVLKSYAQPLLFEIGADSPCYSEARRLLKFLEYFVPITPESIPGNSILREFIGGGCFDL